MKVYCTKNYEEMSRKASNLIFAQIISKPDSVLGLATGSSPLGIYDNLIKYYKNGDLDFSALKTANLDEYCGLEKSSPQSYAYFMYEKLFKHINIQTDNTNIPDGTNQNTESECLRYDQTIYNLGGIDLQLLGIGHNGHIGFNEPSESFTHGTHCVKLAEKTINANKRFFDSIDDVPKSAYTMGIHTIMNAQKIVLIASGSEKADIMYEMIAGDITPKVPASILQLHKDVSIVADEAALEKVLKMGDNLPFWCEISLQFL